MHFLRAKYGPDAMLRPAHIGHLALLRALIREGAREGSFQPELAWDSAASERFFGELRQALKTGYFVVEDRETGAMQTVAVPGYVYWADETVGSDPPVGFGLFRAAPGGGYELWLAGLENALRGKGHGRAMLKALFATPTGQQTRFMRVRREGATRTRSPSCSPSTASRRRARPSTRPGSCVQ